MTQNTKQAAILKNQESTSNIANDYHIESIEEYLCRGGEIRTLTSSTKTVSKKSPERILLASLHHRFPSPESLAMAKEQKRLRDKERRG